METNNELTLTLIQNSCEHLYDWADKAENKKIEWLADNILQRSELLYLILEAENAESDTYEKYSRELQNIRFFIENLFYRFGEIIEESKYDYIWEYFVQVVNPSVNLNCDDIENKAPRFQL